MIEAFDSQTIRDAEAPLLAEGEPLMARAAWGLARSVVALLRDQRGALRGARVSLLVGPGNNGGDTLFAGALLARRGVRVTAYLMAEQVHEDGLAALLDAHAPVVRVVGEQVLPVDGAAGVSSAQSPRRRAREICDTDLLVDGLLGTGGRGPLRGTAGDVVEAITARLDAAPRTAPRTALRSTTGRPVPSTRPHRPIVVAVDVPSGIGADDGTLPGSLELTTQDPARRGTGRWDRVLTADRTVTFGAPTPGLLLPPAAAYAGEIEVVDIGLGLPEPGAARRPQAVRRLSGDDLVAQGVLAPPAGGAHKYTRGVLGVVAGTAQFPGAAVLTVSGAVRTGVGMVRYLGAAEVTSHVLAARPEAVPSGGHVQAWVLGSGIPSAPASSDEGARAQRTRIRQALAQATGELASDIVGEVVPAVIDAGALPLLPEACPPWLVLTPHAGELAELLRARGESVERDAVEAEPLRWATRARELTGATVLLKGAVTVVVGPSGIFAQQDGPPWLATAGSGDVLAGILGALLATHSSEAVKDPALPAVLAASAALLHGQAAHRACPGGPIAALDVADALPATVAALLG